MKSPQNKKISSKLSISSSLKWKRKIHGRKKDIINWYKIMRSIFIKTISFIVFLSLCESALQNILKDDSTRKFLEYGERETALNGNGSKTNSESNGGE